MKALGMLRRQLKAIMSWQVSTVTAVALCIGAPLGVAGGRWAWQLFANQAGVTAGTVTPLALLWMIPVTLIAANLIALRSASVTARLSAAAALRSE
jgi:ABC-type antimicrobial peptide transport system permease subunit